MLNALARMMPFRSGDLEAKLSGVAGHTGYGEFEFANRPGGHSAFEIELRGVAGVSADLYLNNDHVVTVALEGGRADQSFSSRRGGPLIVVRQGDVVEIRQHGDTILQGVVRRD